MAVLDFDSFNTSFDLKRCQDWYLEHFSRVID